MGFMRMVLGGVSCFDDGDVCMAFIGTQAVEKEDKEKKKLV